VKPIWLVRLWGIRLYPPPLKIGRVVDGERDGLCTPKYCVVGSNVSELDGMPQKNNTKNASGIAGGKPVILAWRDKTRFPVDIDIEGVRRKGCIGVEVMAA